MTNDQSHQPVRIAAFYHFQSVPADQVETLAETLEAKGVEMGLKGLIIFATEGINGTICGEPTALDSYLDWAAEHLGFPKLPRKYSEAGDYVFRKFKVRIREEIVTLGKPEVQPLPPKSATHLSPDEWDAMMAREDVIVLDTRNWYETRIGKFKNAMDPDIEEFTEFSEYVQQAGIPKDKKVLIYCTGGIRCEKAIVEMHNQGFNEVYQLDGGILNYLAQKPNKNFEGECFVFDQRVAVDQELKPTRYYHMCPHCGQPADQEMTCLRCDDPAVICVTCKEKGNHLHTCSKNCAHHYQMKPGVKGRPQRLGYRYKTEPTPRRHAPLAQKPAQRG